MSTEEIDSTVITVRSEPFSNPRFDYSAKKTSVFIDPHTSPNSKKQLELSYKASISTHSPYKSVGSPSKKAGDPPLSIHTNSGAKLNLALKLGDTAIYSDNAVRKKEFNGNELKEILKFLFELSSDIKLQELKDCEENSTKHQEGVFSQETRSQTNKRKPNQGSAIANKEHGSYISAKKIVEKFFTEEKMTETAQKLNFSDEDTAALKEQFCHFAVEWLHLIDFANIGNSGQIDQNLVFGVFEANSQMMVTEEYEKRLQEKDEKIKISVDAEIVKFHVAYEIKVSISVSDHTTTVSFNPFSRIPPIVESVQYLEIRENVKRKRTEEKKANINPSAFFSVPLEKAPAKINSQTTAEKPGVTLSASLISS